jgi:hypothetical protein
MSALSTRALEWPPTQHQSRGAMTQVIFAVRLHTRHYNEQKRRLTMEYKRKLHRRSSFDKRVCQRPALDRDRSAITCKKNSNSIGINQSRKHIATTKTQYTYQVPVGIQLPASRRAQSLCQNRLVPYERVKNGSGPVSGSKNYPRAEGALARQDAKGSEAPGMAARERAWSEGTKP